MALRGQCHVRRSATSRRLALPDEARAQRHSPDIALATSLPRSTRVQIRARGAQQERDPAEPARVTMPLGTRRERPVRHSAHRCSPRAEVATCASCRQSRPAPAPQSRSRKSPQARAFRSCSQEVPCADGLVRSSELGLHLGRGLDRQWRENQLTLSDLDSGLLERADQVLP